MNETKIQWTHFPGYDKGMSWNPIRARNVETGKTGWACVHMGEGCRFCYAESLNRRLGTGLDYTAQEKGKYEVYLDEKTLLAPLKAKGKICFFTNSMTDLFGLDFGVKQDMLYQIYAVMAMAPQHLFLNLTKRSKYRREWLSFPQTRKEVEYQAMHSDLNHFFTKTGMSDLWPLENVFEGSSIACQKDLHQLDDLIQTPAHKRFVSYEPAIEAVDLDRYIWDRNHATLDWVILGGESGPHARPFDIQWARDTIEQCRKANVPCFMKQVGAKPFVWSIKPSRWDKEGLGGEPEEYQDYIAFQDKKGGDQSEWPEDIRERNFPEVTR